MSPPAMANHTSEKGLVGMFCGFGKGTYKELMRVLSVSKHEEAENHCSSRQIEPKTGTANSSALSSAAQEGFLARS